MNSYCEKTKQTNEKISIFLQLKILFMHLLWPTTCLTLSSYHAGWYRMKLENVAFIN